MTEDEMLGWYHQLDGHEFEQAPRDGDGQGSLACYGPWDTSLVRPASSLVAIPQACQLSPSPGIKTYIHLQESNSNPNLTLDMSSPPPPFKHLGHFTSIKHPFHKGDEARSAGGEPAFQGEQKPNRGNHLGKLLCCCSVAQSCLDSLRPHGLQHARLPCP